MYTGLQEPTEEVHISMETHSEVHGGTYVHMMF